MMSQLGPDGSGSEGRPTHATLCWVSPYRPPVQGEVDETFFRRLGEASHGQALVLIGDLHHPQNCRRDNRAGPKQFRRLLECIGGSFQTQLVEELAGGHNLPRPDTLNKEDLVRDVKVRGSLGFSDHGMVEFRILRR